MPASNQQMRMAECRRVMVMAAKEAGYTHHEIAQTMKTPDATVSKIVARAKADTK